MNNNLIVKRDKEEFVTGNNDVDKALEEGRIVVPENVTGFLKKAPMKGAIISWGSRCHYSYSEGERIVFGRFSGVPFKWDAHDYYIINEKDILAREEP